MVISGTWPYLTVVGWPWHVLLLKVYGFGHDRAWESRWPLERQICHDCLRDPRIQATGPETQNILRSKYTSVVHCPLNLPGVGYVYL